MRFCKHGVRSTPTTCSILVSQHSAKALLVGYSAGTIHDSVFEVIDGINGSADFFKNAVPAIVGDDFLWQELEPFRITDPGLRVDLRVCEGHMEFQGVMVDAAITFLKPHVITVRITEMIDP